MKILRILRTLVEVKGLKALLLGKEVILADDSMVGMVIDIRRELSQGRIWMVIDNLGQESIVSIEQITSVASKVMLGDDFSSTKLATGKAE